MCHPKLRCPLMPWLILVFWRFCKRCFADANQYVGNVIDTILTKQVVKCQCLENFTTFSFFFKKNQNNRTTLQCGVWWNLSLKCQTIWHVLDCGGEDSDLKMSWYPTEILILRLISLCFVLQMLPLQVYKNLLDFEISKFCHISDQVLNYWAF